MHKIEHLLPQVRHNTGHIATAKQTCAMLSLRKDMPNDPRSPEDIVKDPMYGK